MRGRKDIKGIISEGVNRYSILALAAILLFFAIFALLFVHPVEQLYFDENIYQGIALNILHSGNALWCQYGTGYLNTCYVNQLYHDIVGFDVFIAMAFAIFGPSAQTAYGLELLIGLLSILGVFLLTSLFTRRKEVPVLSALVFSTLPELFIWSRTQAVPDMPFMMFTIFTTFFFVMFVRKPGNNRLALFLMSFTLTFYTRTEGLLLAPLFIILYFVLGENGIRQNVREKLKWLANAFSDPVALSLILIFVLLLLPAIYYSVNELRAPSYGNSSSQALFSFSNFASTLPGNLGFLTATSVTPYPEVSAVNLVPLATAGAITLIFLFEKRNRFGILLSLLLLTLLYLLFYAFFYAGSYGYGVDVRFVLQTLPFLAVLSGLGVFGIGSLILKLLQKIHKKYATVLRYSIYSVLILVFIVYPFYLNAPNITMPASQMPQEAYPSSATSFFYNNYNSVPTNCLVFSFTPDLWYQYGRSAAQIGYLTGENQSLKESFGNYSCFVMDYGYWCTVPPYQGTTCKNDLAMYNISVIASSSNTIGSGFAFYRLVNYSP